MNRIETIRPEFVEFIPSTLQSGVLYVSHKYHTASHLCCCGCGSKVVTHLNPGGWRVSTKYDQITLYPSVGSWSLTCKSHYWIRANRIEWAPQWSQQEIEAGRVRDRLALERYFDASPNVPLRPHLWQRFVCWLTGK